MKYGEGYVFTPVCHSVHRAVCPPGKAGPHQEGRPPPPPGRQTPSARKAGSLPLRKADSPSHPEDRPLPRKADPLPRKADPSPRKAESPPPPQKGRLPSPPHPQGRQTPRPPPPPPRRQTPPQEGRPFPREADRPPPLTRWLLPRSVRILQKMHPFKKKFASDVCVVDDFIHLFLNRSIKISVFVEQRQKLSSYDMCS